MCDEIWRAWFNTTFLPFTAAIRTEETPVVLRVDGFKAHVTPAFVAYAKEHHVEVLLSTPHATDKQAPLDVACNSPAKAYWAQAKRFFRKTFRIALDLSGRVPRQTLPDPNHSSAQQTCQPSHRSSR